MRSDKFILFAEDDTQEAELLRHACRYAGLAESSYLIVRDGLQGSAIWKKWQTNKQRRRVQHTF